jgi:cytochrome c-type biogenesis protein
MMVEHVTLVAAFGAGVLSFISPCVLPLVPGYLSFVSGVSLDDMRSGGQTGVAAARSRVLVSSLAFVAGFSLVFIALGASASVVGQFMMERLTLFGRIAGVVLVIFGLHTMGVFRIRLLEVERRVHAQAKPAGVVGAGLIGVAFAFGWTPCIGPILAGILAVAATQETVMRGVQLLAVYSIGLGVPFLLTSVAVNQFFSVFARIRRYFKFIEVTAGALLIVIGVLIFTNRFTILARWLEPYLPTY